MELLKRKAEGPAVGTEKVCLCVSTSPILHFTPPISHNNIKKSIVTNTSLKRRCYGVGERIEEVKNLPQSKPDNISVNTSQAPLTQTSAQPPPPTTSTGAPTKTYSARDAVFGIAEL